MSTAVTLPLSLFALLVALAIVIFALLGFYETSSSRPARWLQRRFNAWAFTPGDLGGFRWDHLIFASLLCLFLEMLMIRWISAEIPVFSYYKNFVLIACFLGFGVGCYFSKRQLNLVAFLGPILVLTLLLKLPWSPLRAAIQHLPTYIGVTSETLFWDTFSEPLAGYTAPIAGLALVIAIDALVTLLFIPIGQLVGWYLEQKDAGITGYTANVLAGLAGLLLYTLLCFWYQPPVVWFACAGLMVVALFWKFRRGRLASLAAFVFCLLLLSLGPNRPSVELWSPYQKITLTPRPNATTPTSWELQTNDTWYQEMIDLSSKFVNAHLALFRKVPIEFNAYNIPYRFYQTPPSVLVRGWQWQRRCRRCP
jgi:hypothetical protein